MNLSEGRRGDVLDRLARAGGPARARRAPGSGPSPGRVHAGERSRREAPKPRRASWPPRPPNTSRSTDHDGRAPPPRRDRRRAVRRARPDPRDRGDPRRAGLRPVDRGHARRPGVPLRPRRSGAPEPAGGTARRVHAPAHPTRARPQPAPDARCDRGRSASVRSSRSTSSSTATTSDLARTVARRVRERDGGLPGVRALGLQLESRGHAQVSMNLVDLDATGLEAACRAVRDEVEALGAAGRPGRARRSRSRGGARAVQRGVPRVERDQRERDDRSSGRPRRFGRSRLHPGRRPGVPGLTPPRRRPGTAPRRSTTSVRPTRRPVGPAPAAVSVGVVLARTARPRSRTSLR